MILSKFIIISEDDVFTALIHRFIVNKFEQAQVKKLVNYQALRQHHFEKVHYVIILDSPLTGTAEYEIIAYIRLKQEVFAPIIFFSNKEDDREPAIHKGANFFFKKPFVPDEVTDQISIILSSIYESFKSF